MYHDGECGPVDFTEARRLFGLAAGQGDEDAQHKLGCMHRDGAGGSVNLAEARRLLGLAAAQGYANAQEALDAVDRLEKDKLAAAQSDADAHPLGLSMTFQSHSGEDAVESRRRILPAATQGDAEAQTMLGLMHWSGWRGGRP